MSDDTDSAEHLSPETRTAQALGSRDPITRALVPPIYPSTTYERDADGGYGARRGYARPGTPTLDEPEALLNALEGGAGAILLGSGMAACTAVFQALQPGDHIIAPRVMYWALRSWLLEFAEPWGLAVEFVDMTDLDNLKRALRPGATRLVWIETPANPMWNVTSIREAATLAHSAGARLAVDSTVASPVLTRPLEHGADLVVHSASKYLNGHSDVIAGGIVTACDDDYWLRIKAWRRDAGAVLGPFEAWLLLRGMRTLFVRVRRACETAMALARHFEHHELLREVLYPGLPSRSDHNVAAMQMDGGFSGMLSIRHRYGEAGAMATAAHLEVFTRATSLGGVESLVEHRASIEGPSTPVPVDLLRLSIGMEAAPDLIADLEQALAKSIEGLEPVDCSR
ncbi:MAG: PLP-dependent aspartate aminotransferase family protein [Pseudomonadota bacterium]